MKRICYGVDKEGHFYAKLDQKVAFFVLEFGSATPENGWQMKQHIEDGDLYQICLHVNINWTTKVSMKIKNEFRKYFKMKPLKEKTYVVEKIKRQSTSGKIRIYFRAHLATKGFDSIRDYLSSQCCGTKTVVAHAGWEAIYLAKPYMK